LLPSKNKLLSDAGFSQKSSGTGRDFLRFFVTQNVDGN
jgi:hypothetical protein